MKSTLFLLLAAAVIILTPLVLFHGREEVDFGGADGAAMDLVAEIRPGYEPWFEPLWEPPSGEIESLLFALQAAVGTGVLAFAFGWWAGRSSMAKTAGQAKAKTAGELAVDAFSTQKKMPRDS